MTGIQRLRAFIRSPHHAWLALLTLGVGAALASVPGLIGAGAAYALGWVFLPDSKRFKKWLTSRLEGERSAAAGQSAEEFLKQRAAIYAKLSPLAQRAYDKLAADADQIRRQYEGDGTGGKHGGRLGQLVWTYLRLLLTKETLQRFLESESSGEIESQIAAVEAEVAEMEPRVGELEEAGNPTEAAGLRRLIQSKESRIESLRQRREHVRKAEADFALTDAEIDRIHDAVRLIQADLVARRDPDALGGEIDRTTSHFTQTHDWLRDLEFDQTPDNISDEVTASAPLRVAE
ncbi:MAG: hypothetical protein R3F11_30610 [Verrucomicrobiales bacterium]